MNKVQPGIQLNKKIWKKAKNNYVNCSKRVEELIQEDLELENFNDQPVKILDNTGLTAKQERFLDALIEDDRKAFNRPDLGRFARKHGIYSRKDHIKNAVKAIHRNQKVPFEIKNGEMVESQIYCRKCDASFNLTILDKNDMKCPKCRQEYKI